MFILGLRIDCKCVAYEESILLQDESMVAWLLSILSVPRINLSNLQLLPKGFLKCSVIVTCQNFGFFLSFTSTFNIFCTILHLLPRK